MRQDTKLGIGVQIGLHTNTKFCVLATITTKFWQLSARSDRKLGSAQLVIALDWTALMAAWKKAARQQARLLLVLGVPAISPRISPDGKHTAYRTSSNFSNTSIMCKSFEFN